MSCLLAAGLIVAAAGGHGLSINVSSPQRAILAAEPVKLVLRWSTDRPLAQVYLENEDFTVQSLEFLVESDTGQRVIYTEAPHATDERQIIHGGLQPGQVVTTTLVLMRGSRAPSAGGAAAFLFPSKGRYSLRVRYKDKQPSALTAESNAIRFEVAEPTDADRVVFEAIKADPAILQGGGDATSQRATRELLQRHPHSPYLRWARLVTLRERSTALHNWYDPDTGLSIFQKDKEAVRELRVSRYREMAHEALTDDWGPFEEEALGLAHLYGRASGDGESIERSRTLLFSKYPHSETAKAIREVEAGGDEVEGDDPRRKPDPRLKQ